jgi:hypothetical protein
MKTVRVVHVLRVWLAIRCNGQCNPGAHVGFTNLCTVTNRVQQQTLHTGNRSAVNWMQPESPDAISLCDWFHILVLH